MCDIVFWHASDSVKKLCLLCMNSQSHRIRKFCQLTSCEDFYNVKMWSIGSCGTVVNIYYIIVSYMKRHGNSSVKLLETNWQST